MKWADNNNLISEVTRFYRKIVALSEIQILKTALAEIGKGYIIFEYTIPRIGHRIDTVYIVGGIVFLLEFKVGSQEFARNAVDQVTDYALDLKNFHKASHDRLLVPILIATRAQSIEFVQREMKPGIHEVIKCNQGNSNCSHLRKTQGKL